MLTLKNGKKVTTAAMWWKQRRPEIVEDFEREVLGRVPKNVPKVTWEVTRDRRTRRSADMPVVGKQLVGHVDNSSYPGDHVDIQMTLVTPGRRQGAGAGDDHVRRRPLGCPAIRRRPAAPALGRAPRRPVLRHPGRRPIRPRPSS